MFGLVNWPLYPRTQTARWWVTNYDVNNLIVLFAVRSIKNHRFFILFGWTADISKTPNALGSGCSHSDFSLFRFDGLMVTHGRKEHRSLRLRRSRISCQERIWTQGRRWWCAANKQTNEQLVSIGPMRWSKLIETSGRPRRGAPRLIHLRPSALEPDRIHTNAITTATEREAKRRRGVAWQLAARGGPRPIGAAARRYAPRCSIWADAHRAKRHCSAEPTLK